MADISKITLPNGSSYDIKDATARSGLAGKAAASHTHVKSEVGLGNVDNTADTDKNVKSATKLQTYKQGSTTSTYGDQYPLYAQWETNSILKLVCSGYTVKTDYATNAGNADTVDSKHASDFAAASHTHTKSQITDFPTSLPANGGTADTAKNLSSFTIPFNRPVANGGNGKQWIKFAEVVDEGIATTNRWYGKALEFEIFNNGYGSNGNFVSMGRVSLCVSVHNQKTFTKEAITIKWQNCKPNAYTINHIVAVVTDTKVEFFVLNDVWDTALTFVITRDIGISYGSTYTSTQYTSDAFTTYYSDKKIIQSSLDTNLYIYNSTKVNNHTVETDVPANAKFTDTTYTLPAATSSTLGGVKIGSNITNSNGTISLTKANVTAALGYTPPTTNTTYDVATQSANGLMSSSDKTKLDGIATGANKTTVDSALSSTSTNPVQNKVINSALTGKAAASHTHTTQSAAATSNANASYLRQIATGTATATTSNCPAGTLYGKY